MASLNCVDYVTIFNERSASALVELLRPVIYAKGGDWQIAPEGQAGAKSLPEAPAVHSYGGTIRLIPYLPGHSTTELIARIKRSQ